MISDHGTLQNMFKQVSFFLRVWNNSSQLFDVSKPSSFLLFESVDAVIFGTFLRPFSDTTAAKQTFA